ncbi:MAG: AAA family ATPase [Peptococcaceae bacterium]|nr:AAA family ATPase [Peptococcaceae bacterium]
MDSVVGFLFIGQFLFMLVVGMYFWTMLRQQRNTREAVEKESRKQKEILGRMRKISLSQPLAEMTRPQSFAEIVGQEDGVKALRAALCTPNPQHVLLYGPPGVGKTAAARLILEEAKRSQGSPFDVDAKFVEMDGATARFDERGIADPLIGSVHDPIYQGAGAMGVAGVPQPKMGAVSKAHGGILFIDEIGELHPIQINKLLKVLEDRKAMLESSYYNSEDPSIPEHIHDIFQNGLPADFRLVGATTRQPSDIPSAVRSRCIEIYFRELMPAEVRSIALNAAARVGVSTMEEALNLIEIYATNGREAVNMIQLAAGVAQGGGVDGDVAGDSAPADSATSITREILEWVISTGCYMPRPHKKIPAKPQIGVANGLAVYGTNLGLMFELEVSAFPAAPGKGKLEVTGIAEEEEQGDTTRKIRRKSMVRSSIENVLTVLRRQLGVEPSNYDLHVNIPGGVPLDGPSAGITIATAVYSAILGCNIKKMDSDTTEQSTSTCRSQNPALRTLPPEHRSLHPEVRHGLIDNTVAMTGEISIRGMVHAVGGVEAKLLAARQSGCLRVIIPKDNWQERFQHIEGLEVVPVETLEEVFKHVMLTIGPRSTTVAAKTGAASAWQIMAPSAASHLPEAGNHGNI